jgi:membrane protease YdiL (CAAX protease family)
MDAVTSAVAGQQILVDVMQWLLWALPLGLLAHQWFGERVVSLAGWDGRPRPGMPVDVVDVAVAVGLVFLLRGHLTAMTPAEPGSPVRALRASDVTAAAAASMVLWLLLLMYLRGLRQRGLTAWFGLPDARRLLSLVPMALIWTVLGGALVYGVAWVFEHRVWVPMGFEPEAQDTVQALAGGGSPLVRVLIVVFACGVAPVVEETVFRGFLYPTLRQFADAPFAALFTAVLFGAVHGSLTALVPLAVLGVVLVLAYEWSRGLALPIAIHALFNLATAVSLWTSGPAPTS